MRLVDARFFLRLRTCLLICFVLLGACSKQDTAKQQKLLPVTEVAENITQYFKFDIAGCSNIYQDENLTLVEMWCDSLFKEKGIFLFNAGQVQYLGWFDAPFNQWATTEGCRDDKSCYYLVTRYEDLHPTELEYHFYINLSEGHFKLKIDQGKWKVVEKNIRDIAS